MFRILGYLTVLSVILFGAGCEQKKEEFRVECQGFDTLKYAIVGHAYGNPNFPTNSLYPPFLKAFDNFYDENECEAIIFTGDVVKEGTDETWRTVAQEVGEMGVQSAYLAPGNHDQGDYLTQDLEVRPYSKFVAGDNLFLMLNTTRAGWTIDSAQTAFLERTFEDEKEYANIFVFTHQLWWLKNRPASFGIDSIRPNSFALYDGEEDFWNTTFPIFGKRKEEIYFFAGDLGCCIEIAGYFEQHIGQYHFYGSGVGGGAEDNFISLEVFQDNTVKIDRIDF